MVRTVKAPMVNPYAKTVPKKTKTVLKTGTKKTVPKKAKEVTWGHRWHQNAGSNPRKTKHVPSVSPNPPADPMDLVGGCFSYQVKPGTIMPHPSNPTFFLPTQLPSSDEEATDSENDEVEVVPRRISLSPPLAQTQSSPESSPERIVIKKEKRAHITATITFHDDDFLEGIIQRVSENIGDLMLSYYAGQSKNVSSV
jgi:hypothetical protein